MMNDTTRRQRPASGQFVLRIDPGLHASLREAASASNVSLNRYCARRLAAPGTWPDPAAPAVVRRSASILGDSLLGVVAFGSRMRGDHTPASDVDVLAVVEDRTAISRDLYRRWDAEPSLTWDGHRVEPHFVHLPPESETPSGLWAEVALDGVVLFERALAVSERLAAIRRQILAGRVSRRVARGQSYWVRAG